MSRKQTKLGSILSLKCPKCRTGNLFLTKHAYQKGMAKMNTSCPSCGERFDREPGFYFGAAYVSYGLTIAIWVALFVALVVFDLIGLISFSIAEDSILYLVLGVVFLILLMPFVYRLSRSMWINMFVKFESEQK